MDCVDRSRVALEPASELAILARFEAGTLVRLRTTTPDCEIDAGGLPVVWFDGVKPDDSVAWLTSRINTTPSSGERFDRCGEACRGGARDARGSSRDAFAGRDRARSRRFQDALGRALLARAVPATRPSRHCGGHRSRRGHRRQRRSPSSLLSQRRRPKDRWSEPRFQSAIHALKFFEDVLLIDALVAGRSSNLVHGDVLGLGTIRARSRSSIAHRQVAALREIGGARHPARKAFTAGVRGGRAWSGLGMVPESCRLARATARSDVRRCPYRRFNFGSPMPSAAPCRRVARPRRVSPRRTARDALESIPFDRRPQRAIYSPGPPFASVASRPPCCAADV